MNVDVREQYWTTDKSDKEALLIKRSVIKKDLALLTAKPPYEVRIDGCALTDTQECTNVLILFKEGQINDIDKKLGI